MSLRLSQSWVEHQEQLQALRQAVEQIMWPFKPGEVNVVVDHYDYDLLRILLTVEKLDTWYETVPDLLLSSHTVLDQVALQFKQIYDKQRVPTEDHICLGEN